MTATTIDTTLTQTETALPSAREIARKLAALLAFLAAGALLVVVLPGFEAIPAHLAGADPAWIAAALVFEIASTVTFAVVFHGAYERRVSRRTSASLAMAVQGMNIVLPAGGTGGLAAGAVIMDRAGVPRSFAASRTVALFLITSLASFAAIALACSPGTCRCSRRSRPRSARSRSSPPSRRSPGRAPSSVPSRTAAPVAPSGARVSTCATASPRASRCCARRTAS
jgi:hypothetical protein